MSAVPLAGTEPVPAAGSTAPAGLHGAQALRAMLGIALSVFMSFRNNACYARWWEGRHLWGELIIACRSVARQTSTLDEQDRRFLLHGLCGFTAGLAARLRGQDELDAIRRWTDIGLNSSNPNPTNQVLDQIGKYCLTLMRQDRIGAIHYSVLEGQITALSNVQGGCERIAHTPVPFAYSLLLHRTAVIFCVTLPFALDIANKGAKAALKADKHLANGLNVADGKITHAAVAHDLDLPFAKPAWLKA